MTTPVIDIAGALLLALAAGGPAAGAEDLRNWFDDPFLRVTDAVADCPEPAGPRVTQAERLAQSHRRAEKGTTCWLHGDPDCQRASAYAYDSEIAERLAAAIRDSGHYAATSLWLTVQGRVAYLEGCVAADGQAQELEALARGIPGVQQAIALVSSRPLQAPPYRRFRPAAGD